MSGAELAAIALVATVPVAAVLVVAMLRGYSITVLLTRRKRGE